MQSKEELPVSRTAHKRRLSPQMREAEDMHNHTPLWKPHILETWALLLSRASWGASKQFGIRNVTASAPWQLPGLPLLHQGGSQSAEEPFLAS